MSTYTEAASAGIALHGPDAARFLQGQVSADVIKLPEGGETLAGLHNPQGRVIALLQLTRVTPTEFLAVLPADLVAAVAARLRKYVLRAKLSIEELPPGSALPGAISSGLIAVRAGLPQVYASTSEQFVAQMLNLDLLGAIAFDKGCYTGQEVIARAHYRGRVKRRLQRWRNDSGQPLRPGDTARSTDGRSLTVVRVANDEQGRQELLAVGNYGALDPESMTVDATGIVIAGPLPLPYALPE